MLGVCCVIVRRWEELGHFWWTVKSLKMEGECCWRELGSLMVLRNEGGEGITVVGGKGPVEGLEESVWQLVDSCLMRCVGERWCKRK